MHQTRSARGTAPSRRPSRLDGLKARSQRSFHFATFAGPALIIFFGLVLVPMVMTIGTSLTNRNNFIPGSEFVGLDNYKYLLHDQAFLQALKNTLVLVVIVTVVPNVLGLLVALMLDRPTRTFSALRAVFFVPVVLSGVVVSVIWGSILTDDGLLNSTLANFGIVHPPGWLSDPALALYSIGFIMSWQSLGFCVVIYLAGLQGVPKELNEAAEIDGAGRWTRFRFVTWPMLAPAVTVTTVVSLINGFKAYDQVQVITNGGPGIGATNTLAFDIVREGINGVHVGYAATMATVMLILVAVTSVIAMTFLRRREVEL